MYCVYTVIVRNASKIHSTLATIKEK